MRKVLLLAAGWALLALGAVGAFVPVLPTTPFVLVSAGCFSCASPRLYGALSRNRFFGPYIENYRAKTGITNAAKARGIIVVWALLILSMAHLRRLPITLALIAVGIGVTIHLLMIRKRVD